MDLRYNAACDSAYILLDHGRIVSTRRLPGLRRMVDYDGLGRPLGVILHQTRRGVDLEGLPFADEIATLLTGCGIPVCYGVEGTGQASPLAFVRRRVPAGADAAEIAFEPHRHDSAA